MGLSSNHSLLYSYKMFSALYISALAGTVIFGASTIAIHFNIGRFYGRTLSGWVNKNRSKDDEITAEKLMNIRKRLENLAHDLLKHRLLGLNSLTHEMRLYFNEDNPKKLTADQLNDMRDEFFRLCGLQKSSDERLWYRLIQSLKDIVKAAGRSTTLPHFDPMFEPIIKVIVNLRSILRKYVDDKDNVDITLKLSRIDLSKCTDTYNTVLKLADSSRMVIQPEEIIQNAISTLESQTNRAGIEEHIHIYNQIKDKLLCQAPARTLMMCLIRLMDNALEQGADIGLDVSFSENDFTGESCLIFKIYDSSDHMPTTGEYGLGMRGVKQSLSTFEGGIQYRLENRDNYKKAAVISIPASRYTDCPVVRRTWKSNLLLLAIYIISVTGFLFSLWNVLGGPPVEFAGEGNSIIEFSVNAGEKLYIPLCKGGRKVRAEIENANNACFDNSCSFSQVLNELDACAQSLDDPKCPGAIIWTPKFEDGLRIGKNYEITVHCISEGPPDSEDFQRIRVLVQRPNSTPALKLLQLINETRGETHYLNNDLRSVKMDVTDKIQLRVLAIDDDSDPIIYYLKYPNGKIESSIDGSFIISPEWSPFGTSTFELTISDNMSKTNPIPIVLEADHLHPIELRNLTIWNTSNATNTPCEGNSESRICRIPSQQSSELSMQLWFDPMQQNVHPIIRFDATDMLSLDIKPTNHANETRIGDLWEIYTKPSNALVGFIELTNIEATSTTGLYNYTFNLTTTPSLPASANMALNLNIEERSHRMPELKTLLVFVHHSESSGDLSFNTRSLQLTEYEREEDASDANASIWVYPQAVNHSLQSPVIDDIVCQTPEFSQAFEKPTIHNLHNAWRIDFKLKRGCIPGLNHKLTSKQRLCAANLHMPDSTANDEVLWIMLQNRDCMPYIDALNLSSTRNELNDNIFKWNFSIIDPDSVLKPSNIHITGAEQYNHNIQLYRTAPTNYTGIITIEANCFNSAGINSKIYMQGIDNSGNQLLKHLSITPNCPPLVSTDNNQSSFKVSEGETLYVPLKHDNDVAIALNSAFGKIVNDAFVWTASCRYGKGPHTVEITTSHAKNYGKPLQFEIEITHCQPRFTLYLDDQVIQPGTPALLSVNSQHQLSIQSATNTDHLTFIPQIRENIPNVRISEQSDTDHYQINLECTDSNVSNELMIRVQSDDFDESDIPPIMIPIECI